MPELSEPSFLNGEFRFENDRLPRIFPFSSLRPDPLSTSRVPGAVDKPETSQKASKCPPPGSPRRRGILENGNFTTETRGFSLLQFWQRNTGWTGPGIIDGVRPQPPSCGTDRRTCVLFLIQVCRPPAFKRALWLISIPEFYGYIADRYKKNSVSDFTGKIDGRFL